MEDDEENEENEEMSEEDEEDEEIEGEDKFEEDYEDDEQEDMKESSFNSDEEEDEEEDEEDAEEYEAEAEKPEIQTTLDENLREPETPEDQEFEEKVDFVEPEADFDPTLSLQNVEPVRREEIKATSKEIIRRFSKTEIQEIYQYISTNIPYSILTQQFPLVEKPYEKAKVFTTVYRFINSAMHYVSTEETRRKLQSLLKDSTEVYETVYPLLQKYDSAIIVNFNRHRLLRKIERVFTNMENNAKVNKLIDAFLVFAEKQELMDIDKITGLDLETPEGQKAHKAITTGEFQQE